MFIEVTDHDGNSWLLNKSHIRAIAESSNGKCLILGEGNNELRPVETYIEVKKLVRG